MNSTCQFIGTLYISQLNLSSFRLSFDKLYLTGKVCLFSLVISKGISAGNFFD